MGGPTTSQPYPPPRPRARSLPGGGCHGNGRRALDRYGLVTCAAIVPRAPESGGWFRYCRAAA